MKKALLFASLVGLVIFYGMHVVSAKHTMIVDEQGQVSQDVLELLKLTGIEHNGSLASIVQGTQAAWLRKPGVERWEVADRQTNKKDQFLDCFKKMNLIDQINPSQQKYDYALWMGAGYIRVADRLQFLIDAWQQGVRFDHFVILSGARPLTDEEKQALARDYNFDELHAPQTETDAMQLVYQNIAMPQSMRAVPVTIIDVPMQTTAQGTLTRPTTADTVNYWLAENPKPGTCLVVSNQPYVPYQDSVVKTLLPTDFIVETVGRASQDCNIDVHLDNLARILYQEKNRLNL